MFCQKEIGNGRPCPLICDECYELAFPKDPLIVCDNGQVMALSEYSKIEQECWACTGPCGRCEELKTENEILSNKS